MTEKQIYTLEHLDWRQTSIEAVRTLLYEIGEIPATKVTLLADSVIHRTRVGWEYHNEKELSYPDAVLCTTIKRATLSGETAFYGSLSDDYWHGENARTIGAAECLKFNSSNNEQVEFEKITCSQWTTLRPLSVLSFITDETYPDADNRWIQLFRSQFVRNKEMLSDLQLRFIRVVNSFFTEKVDEGDEYKYKLTSSLVHDVLYNIPQPNGAIGFDAVVYPSVAMEGKAGVNIVIRPDVASRALKLNYIVEEGVYTYRNQSIIVVETGLDSERHMLCGRQCTDEEICLQLGITKLIMSRSDV